MGVDRKAEEAAAPPVSERRQTHRMVVVAGPQRSVRGWEFGMQGASQALLRNRVSCRVSRRVACYQGQQLLSLDRLGGELIAADDFAFFLLAAQGMRRE